MLRKALLDACVLVPYHLCDLLLYLAEEELYEPLWSEELLDEVERNLPKFGVTPTRAARRVGHMRSAFPFSAVENYEELTSAMTNDQKDRHVLAAAVLAEADVIVTANLKDFPASAVSPYGIEVVHPDEFLLDLLELSPDRVLRCLASQRADYARPTMTFLEFYESLKKTVPNFADSASVAERARLDPNGPLPLEIVSGDDAAHAFFPDGNPSPETPLGAAFLWWLAVTHLGTYDEALKELSYDPSDWGDYRQTAATLNGWSMMQNVHLCEDAPDEIAYIKLMRDTGYAMRAFAGAAIADYQVITVVRCVDGLWRVWGHSERHIPSARRVKYGVDD